MLKKIPLNISKNLETQTQTKRKPKNLDSKLEMVHLILVFLKCSTAGGGTLYCTY